jgi:hypothetical protein
MIDIILLCCGASWFFIAGFVSAVVWRVLRDPVAEESSPPCATFDPEHCHWCKITDADYHPLP